MKDTVILTGVVLLKSKNTVVYYGSSDFGGRACAMEKLVGIDYIFSSWGVTQPPFLMIWQRIIGFRLNYGNVIP